MGKYLLRRILIFVPTLIVITLLGFVLSVSMPGDPVERMVSAAQSGGEMNMQSANLEEQKRLWRKKLGLDLPVFYFSLGSFSEPDTLYRIYDRREREAMGRFIARYGNWEEIAAYHAKLLMLRNHHFNLKIDSINYVMYTVNEIREAVNESMFESISLLSTYDETVLDAKFSKLAKLYTKYAFLGRMYFMLGDVSLAYDAMREKATPWTNHLPALHFYPKNQYHRWIFGDGNWLTGYNAQFTSGLVRGDFGLSFTSKQPISNAIGIRIAWSLLFTLLSVIFAYLISIPLGIRAAVRKDSVFDRTSTVILFVLYSMPSFWVATLLLMGFANTDALEWFPASGVKPATGYPDDAGFLEKAGITLPYLILPLLCYTYSSFAFLSRTMRVSMLETVKQDFIRTARAKGLDEQKIIYKHALRNALLPIITVFSNIFPFAIGGSVILETIFTLPGMGLEMFNAIMNKDNPTIIAVLTLAGMLTLVGYLLADVLYALVDPRISYTKA